MVAGWLTLPTLPSLPQGLVDLLDTSPQVFYPPSRPSSRAGPASSNSCPSSPSPRRRPRPLSMGDARILFVPPSPLPPFNPTAHPHTDSPLESTRAEREGSGSGFSGLGLEQTSPLLAQSTFGGAPIAPVAPPRPKHRRSQSLAPIPASSSGGVSPTIRTRGIGEVRNPITSASAASLPTLDEDAEGRSPGRHPPTPLNEPLWLQASLRRTQTLPRGRRGAPQPMTTASESTNSTSSASATTGLAIFTNTTVPPRSNSSIPFASPRRARTFIRRDSCNSLAFPDTPLSPSPMVSASTSVCDIAALATLAQDPVRPISTLSRSQSVSSASDRLRERLRTLKKLDPASASKGSIPSPQLGSHLSPATPRSAHAKLPAQVAHATPTGPSHEPRTPGSSTPTTNSHGAAPPSPTPTRPHRPAYLSHAHRYSLPDALLLVPDARHNWSQTSHSSSSSHAQVARPHASRLLQPAQLQMSSTVAPNLLASHSNSRRGSLLEPPMSPLLSSSPGSLMSDTGSGTEETNSPTTSVEDLALGPLYPLRAEREQSRELSDVMEQPYEKSYIASPEPEHRYSHDLLASRTSRDIRELMELRESLRHSTSSLRTNPISRSKSLRESTHSTRSSLRESTRSNLSSHLESPRGTRHSRRESWQGHGTSHAHLLNLSTSSYARERRDSFAKDPIHHPTHGTRVVLSTYNHEDEDRFLDFDDI